MKIEMVLDYDGVYESETGSIYSFKDETSLFRIEVSRELLPAAFQTVADAHRDETMGHDLPVSFSVSWST